MYFRCHNSDKTPGSYSRKEGDFGTGRITNVLILWGGNEDEFEWNIYVNANDAEVNGKVISVIRKQVWLHECHYY